HLHLGAGPRERAFGRMQVAGAVVQQNHRGTHSAPFVDGTPLTRGSGSTAARSARATALNSASVTWCWSRPYSTRTCSAMRALSAIDSKTCRLSTVEYGAPGSPRPRTGDPGITACSRWSGSPTCTQYGRPDTSTAAWARV